MSIEIGKVSNIPVRLHLTFVIGFVLIAWTLATSFMPNYVGNLSGSDYWVMGGIGATVLFASVLLHELAHSLVAERFGIRVKQIVLFIFGGVSDIAHEVRDVRQEIKIAVAGPMASFILAGIFASAWWLLTLPPGVSNSITEAILYYGLVANAILGAFNLIPAFPLDGGRILRAFLCMHKRDYDSATIIATRIGMALSYGFMALGFLALVLARDFVGSIWLVLIGLFIHLGAASYLAQHRLATATYRVAPPRYFVAAVLEDLRKTIDELERENTALRKLLWNQRSR